LSTYHKHKHKACIDRHHHHHSTALHCTLLSSMNSTNTRDHGGAAAPAAAAAAAAAAPSADSKGDAHPPLWSSDPTVNAMVILLLQKGLATEEGLRIDHGSSPSLPSLLETLKQRMQAEQQAQCTTTSTTDQTQSRNNKTQSRNHKTHSSAPASSHGHDIPRLARAATQASVFHRVPTVSESSGQSQSHSETDTVERQENMNIHFNGGGPSTGDGAASAPGPISSAAPGASSSSTSKPDKSEVDPDPEPEPQGNAKPTRRELLEALQQHLDILEKRGTVSNVIPTFLRRPRQTQVKRGLQSEETGANQDQVSTSSTKAVGRKKPRLCTSKFQYYEDLATELLQNVMIPIPEFIYVPLGSSDDANGLDSQTEGETTEFTGDSTDLESFCSAASSSRKSPHHRAPAT
jgi:hypothetical protein